MLAKLSKEEFQRSFQNIKAQGDATMRAEVEHTREAMNRRHYLDYGCPSLFEFLTRILGYSNRAAQDRIDAARCLNLDAVVAEKIETGEHNLTHLAKLQQSFRAQEKMSGEKLSKQRKVEILNECEGKSSKQIEEVVITHFPEVAKIDNKVRRLNENQRQITLTLSEDEYQKIMRVKEVLSHTLPDANEKNLFLALVDEFLKRKDPLTKSTSAAKVNPNSISAQVRRHVHQRDQGCCQWREGSTHCQSRHQVQVDHILPPNLGGDHSPDNLRLLCRQHNMRHAERIYGKPAMHAFWTQ